jgi:hypothetical protein
LTQKVRVLSDEEYELLDFLLTESSRPVTFLALFHRDDLPEACQDTLRKGAPLLRRGAVPQASPLPLTRDLNMRNPFSFASLPCWSRIFKDKSKKAQRAVYRDPEFRNALREELKGAINWTRITVHEVHTPTMKPLEGRTVADIAHERGKDGCDIFLDLTLEDDLDIEFVLAQFNTMVPRLQELLVNNLTAVQALAARTYLERAMEDPRRLRGLAVWYGEFAERAGNPAIWEARLRTAPDLEREADRLERAASRAAAILAFATGLLVAVLGAAADEPPRPQPSAKRGVPTRPTAKPFAPPGQPEFSAGEEDISLRVRRNDTYRFKPL